MSEGDHWFMAFVVRDWLTDEQVTLLKESTRGIWMDALCRMFMDDRKGQIAGTIEDLSRLCRTSVNPMRAAIDDLKLRSAADVTERDGIVTLMNRRMRREWIGRKSARDRQKRKREREANGVVTEMSHGESPPLSNSHSNNQIKKDSSESADADGASPADDFEKFWGTWPKHPRKVGKAKCRELWQRKRLSPLAARIISSLESSKRSSDWARGFVPMPMTWLNRTPWETDPEDLEALPSPESDLDPDDARMLAEMNK